VAKIPHLNGKKWMFERSKGWKCSKTLIFLKKVKYFFDLYLIDLIEFIF